MLDSHIHHIHDSGSSGLSASVENAGLGLWVLAKSRTENQKAARTAVKCIELAVERGENLIKSIEAAHSYLKENRNDDGDVEQVSVVACLFDSFHYELSWVGDACAFLFEKDGDSATPLTSRDGTSNAFYLGDEFIGRIPRVLGDMHSGEILLLCAEPFADEMSDTVSSHLLGAELLSGLSSERLARDIQSQCAGSDTSFAILRYEEERQSIRKSDFEKHRARASGRTKRAKTASPSPQLMIVLAMFSVLSVALAFALFA